MSRIKFLLPLFFVVECAFVLCVRQDMDTSLAARESMIAEFEGAVKDNLAKGGVLYNIYKPLLE